MTDSEIPQPEYGHDIETCEHCARELPAPPSLTVLFSFITIMVTLVWIGAVLLR